MEIRNELQLCKNLDWMQTCSNLTNCVRLDFVALSLRSTLSGLLGIPFTGLEIPILQYVLGLHLVNSRFSQFGITFKNLLYRLVFDLKCTFPFRASGMRWGSVSF